MALTLVLFPQVGFAPPYHFTENITGVWDWILPGIVLLSGIIIHGCFTGRLPLVAAWVIGFALQGQFRAWLSGTPHLVPFMPMTSAAFIVFTLYMVPDPATTPLKPWRQAVFGFSVAMVYGASRCCIWSSACSLRCSPFARSADLSLHLYYAFKSRAWECPSSIPCQRLPFSHLPAMKPTLAHHRLTL